LLLLPPLLLLLLLLCCCCFAAVFFKGEDIKEGLAAVKEKRQPRFKSTAAIDPALAEAGSQHGGSGKHYS
jgi:hypothetical protein